MQLAADKSRANAFHQLVTNACGPHHGEGRERNGFQPVHVCFQPMKGLQPIEGGKASRLNDVSSKGLQSEVKNELKQAFSQEEREALNDILRLFHREEVCIREWGFYPFAEGHTGFHQ